MKDREQRSGSDLDKVIAPEIEADAFYDIIENLAATETLDSVLEIGSSSGAGSTRAFVSGLSRNPGSPKLFCVEVSGPRFEMLRAAYASHGFVHCYNRSTVSPEQFPAPEAVIKFYNEVASKLRQFPLPQVLGWLRQDIRYVRESGVEAGAIEQIKADHGIDTFDMVLIDGSEFTGEVEYGLIEGAKLILLDDTSTFKCHAVRQILLNDPMYDLVADDQTLRNGYSVFRRRATARRVGGALPVHFFTIVLNGEPFIRYHERVFQRLIVPWHWHIVEGVAALRHDTGWSLAGGGKVPDDAHDNGRSNDGTSLYLDDLVRRFPDNVTLYRKPLGAFWDGKREMVNAPLPNIDEDCLLWQVDADELWTVEQIHTVHEMFSRDPTRTAAWYWCWYYVGPGKIISTRYNYAENPLQEWVRTWRYTPGAVWTAHEPPILTSPAPQGATTGPVDLGKVNPFTQDEMEAAGAVFHHLAYVTEGQIAFKEAYYGYKGAREQWRALLDHKGSGALKDYFGWVSDSTMFDDAVHFMIDPLAQPDPVTPDPATADSVIGSWIFNTGGADSGLLTASGRKAAMPRPRIVIDGIVWQYLSSGIGRVWENLLREWVVSGFTDNVVVLDRGGTAPRIVGVHYRSIPRHEYTQTGRDSLYLETVCRRLRADIFVSTYYSAPASTPSFFFGHDMIPEVLGFPLDEEAWKEKRRAILHASAHGMISANSARDLERTFGSIAGGSTYVAHCGVDPKFKPSPADEVTSFRKRYRLGRQTYVLFIGERFGFGGYKNGTLAFRALAELPAERKLTLICVGGQENIEPELRDLAPRLNVRRLALNDADLRAAYTGAHALLYPSKYEGFGMPPLESMACGTPAIVCRNSSLPEVVGDAALYVDEDDPAEMTDAILKLYDPATRSELLGRGVRQAARFTFTNMASEVAKALVETHDRLRAGVLPPPNPAWTELRGFQQGCQTLDIGVDVTQNVHGDGGLTSSVRFIASPALEDALRTIQAMRNSRFWKARNVALRVYNRLRRFSRR